MADETQPVFPETEAEQQAKQEASLPPEELAALEVERREALKKREEESIQAEEHWSTPFMKLSEHVNDLASRVEALEAAALASSKTSSSKVASDSSSTVPKSN